MVAIPEERLPAHLRTPYDRSHDLVGDTGKLRLELGYREPVGLDEVMIRTVAWERRHPPNAVDTKLFDYAAENAVLHDWGLN